jgi:Flp pilus assembly protein TadD
MRPAVAIAIATVTACAHAPAPPPAPAVSVRDEIREAEKAEMARRHDIARTHYEQAVAAAHDPASEDFASYKFGETLATWGEFAEAMTQLEKAIAARPGDAAAWHDLGVIREHEGNVTGAIAALEKSRDLAPDDYRPRRTLAVTLWKHGYRDRAAAEYREMLKFDLPDRLRAQVEWALQQLGTSP